MRVLSIILGLILNSVESRTIPHSSLYGHGWKQLAPIASGVRQEHSVTAIADLVYIIGGIESGLVPTNKVDAYNTRHDSWTSVAPLPLALNHANVASVDGKIYVLGGLNVTDNVFRAVGNSYLYDPRRNRWTPLAPLPAGTERGSAAVGVHGTRIYLAGGLRKLVAKEGGPQESVDTVSVFDTKISTWTQLPSLPARRDHVGGAIVSDKFYVIAGRDRGPLNVRDTVYALDLRAPYSWSERAKVPTARGGVATGVVKNKIYIFGGEGNPANGSSGVFPQNEVYDPRRDRWQKVAPMPIPRHGTGAVAIGNTIYIPGGGDAIAGSPVAVNDAYCPRDH